MAHVNQIRKNKLSYLELYRAATVIYFENLIWTYWIKSSVHFEEDVGHVFCDLSYAHIKPFRSGTSVIEINLKLFDRYTDLQEQKNVCVYIMPNWIHD